MNNPYLVPAPESIGVVTFTILSNDSPVSRAYHVLSIITEKQANKIPSAKIILRDGDPAKGNFEISSADDFLPGNEIEIRVGYHETEETLFKGLVIRHGVKVRSGKPSVLTVNLKHAAVRLTVGRKSAFYYDVSDSDIAREILDEHNLDAEIEDTAVVHKEMVRYRCSDWDFLLSRMDVMGKLVLVGNERVLIRAPNPPMEPALSLAYGSPMIEFEAEVDARHQLAAVASHAWDAAEQSRIEVDGVSPFASVQGDLDPQTLAEAAGPDSYQLDHGGQITDEELQAWADARLQKSRLAKVRGRVRCRGFAAIQPGDTLELLGVGKRFNGNAFVTGVRHEVVRGSWTTDIQFGLSPRWYREQHTLEEPGAGGLLPSVRGLHVGVVRQLEADPDGEDRILVNLPMVDPEDEGIWARLASLDAGENRGAVFRPEIGDEVVVGFFSGDPRHPVVLGMLHSSAKPAPLPGSDDNHEKGLVSRGDMRLIFHDETHAITISTPEGNSIVLSEEAGGLLIRDQNGNTIEMNENGIKVESAADLILKATGDVKLEGANIGVQASAAFKAEGGSGAELSTGATAVIKGSLVQIN